MAAVFNRNQSIEFSILILGRAQHWKKKNQNLYLGEMYTNKSKFNLNCEVQARANREQPMSATELHDNCCLDRNQKFGLHLWAA